MLNTKFCLVCSKVCLVCTDLLGTHLLLGIGVRCDE